MLKQLTIVNYALIKQLNLRFETGFSTITGETGAGKSIMLGALGLVLGNRADTKVLFDKNRKCSVEATFGISGYGLETVFSENDLDFEEEALFRREINPAGKSRAFINDTPVNLNLLREIGGLLINVHSQHEILVLNNSDFQLAMIDAFAGLERKVSDYHQTYRSYKRMQADLKEHKELFLQQLAQHDYDTFLLDELILAQLESVDLATLESEIRLLEHAEEVKVVLSELTGLLEGEPYEMISRLKMASGTLERVGSGTRLSALSDRLKEFCLEGEDLQREIARVLDHVVDDPERLQVLTQQINQFQHLLQKHRVSDIPSLVEIRDTIDTRLQQHSNTGDAIERLEKECDVLFQQVVTTARALSKERTESIKPLVGHLTELLSKLGMPDAVIQVQLEPLPEPGPDGTDRIILRFSANLGAPPDLISRIASGGELSRFMLAIKSVLSLRKLIPTIIFDEIDTGVSGEIAGKTGNIMKQMADQMQVIAITHLPQIAAKGTSQYLVAKTAENGRTISTVRLLRQDEREIEIARMLSDSEPTEVSIANARELLYQEPT